MAAGIPSTDGSALVDAASLRNCTFATGREVLVVEDEPVTRRLICWILERQQFRPEPAEDGSSALARFRAHRFPVVLLDLQLPDIDGFEVCRSLRSLDQDVAILMLTMRREVRDRVTGFEVGADDYIVKPFEPAELIARLRAVLRRCLRATLEHHLRTSREFTIDFENHRAFKVGTPLDLTEKEFSLLAAFLLHPGEVLSREALEERVWGKGHQICPKGLDVYIRRLREKVEDDPSHPRYIQTVRGIGYRSAYA